VTLTRSEAFPTAGANFTRRVVRVEAGTAYSILVGSNMGFVGAFKLSWQITQQPVLTSVWSSRTVATGSTVTLSADIVSPFTASYQWLRNGAPIAGATNATLKLDPVQVADAGEYRIRVSGSPSSPTEFSSSSSRRPTTTSPPPPR
jgi:hypothetical protein